MNSRFIIVAILIFIKVIGIASHARANYTCTAYGFDVSSNYTSYKDYNNSFDSDGFLEPYLNEHGQKSILGIAVDSACAKKEREYYDFLKSKGIF